MVGADFVEDVRSNGQAAVSAAFQAQAGILSSSPTVPSSWMSPSALLVPSTKATRLGPIFVDLSSPTNREKNLRDILAAVHHFFTTSPIVDSTGAIQLELIGSLDANAPLIELRFTGNIGELVHIRTRYFRPPRRPASTALAPVLLFVAFLLPLLWAGGIVLAASQGAEVFYDFLAYAFPLAAAVTGGMGLFYRKLELQYFWASAAFLALGFAFYLLAKGTSSSFFVIYVVLLTLVLLGFVIYDSRKFKHERTSRLDGFIRVTLPLALLFSIPGLLFAFVRSFPHMEETCQITIVAPAKIIIPTVPKKSTENSTGGLSGEWSSDRDVVIKLSPCFKKKG